MVVIGRYFVGWYLVRNKMVVIGRYFVDVWL
jgi:hypothetical protein